MTFLSSEKKAEFAELKSSVKCRLSASFVALTEARESSVAAAALRASLFARDWTVCNVHSNRVLICMNVECSLRGAPDRPSGQLKSSEVKARCSACCLRSSEVLEDSRVASVEDISRTAGSNDEPVGKG